MASAPTYDYIIAGAGCAGLSLALHLIRSGKFTGQKILLLDQDLKTSNDRTWCFWEETPGIFEPVVFRQWEHLWFYGEQYDRKLDIGPCRYKMIRGIDFYQYCLQEIKAQPNFTVQHGRIAHVVSSPAVTGVVVDGLLIRSRYVFSSILFEKPRLSPGEYWLLQHFKGRIIETDEDAFDTGTATLMDFRVDQREGTAFCYVLPFSARQALVEYTLFSAQVLRPEAYDAGLDRYMADVLQLPHYHISAEEYGVIPMTNFRFAPRQNCVINIGTAGGQTKGSSGYTFRFIQKHSAALVHQLIQTGAPFLPAGRSRFSFYDSVLLDILHHGSLPGRVIFTELFKKNAPRKVLQFLDNESTLTDELRIISTLPTLPFLQAAIRQLF